jgi:uncharacterized protein
MDWSTLEGCIPLGACEGPDGAPQGLRLDRANRHGVVAGATGTGKTVTLQIMAEGFSRAGVPVFAADVKGDLSGISQAGAPNEKMLARAQGMGITLSPTPMPTVFWDLFGQKGHPVRATVSEMGPLLLSRILELNDVQEGVLNVTFRVADQQGLLLLDLKDLQAMLKYVADHATEIGAQYGNVSVATVGTIQRKLLTLDTQGAAHFFGEPALQLSDLMRLDAAGRGYVNVLAADQLILSPQLYATFLLWLLSELYETLPEVGDPEKPKLVFFFDEAHLLFNDAPKPLLDKVEQVVRLIRSKGVGIYFVTQNPADIPDGVLAQLGNRVQHALRAYTPSDQKGLRLASQSFRPNPAFDTGDAIQALGVGEALVSVLDEKGAPSVVQRTLIRPPDSRMGPALPPERAATMAASPVSGVYDAVKDRESAFERLSAVTRQAQAQAQAEADAKAQPPEPRYEPSPWGPPPTQTRSRAPAAPRASNRQSMGEALAKSVLRSVGSAVGRELMRGIMGSLRKR